VLVEEGMGGIIALLEEGKSGIHRQPAHRDREAVKDGAIFKVQAKLPRVDPKVGLGCPGDGVPKQPRGNPGIHGIPSEGIGPQAGVDMELLPHPALVLAFGDDDQPLLLCDWDPFERHEGFYFLLQLLVLCHFFLFLAVG